MPTCDEQLLFDYASQFLGYGSLNSCVWLIGPEAGGGRTIDDAQNRASVWAQRGRKETEDLQGYHSGLNRPLEFDWKRNIQKTWGALIRVILALQDGQIAKTDDVREFQRKELGRSDGNNCVLDLSQLSSPSMSEWKFEECGISWLRTREEYEARLLPQRCDLFKCRLAHYKPRLALFYGDALRHQGRWERIANNRFAPSELPRLSWVQGEHTLFAMMPHPRNVRVSGQGAHKRFFADVGMALRERLHTSDLSLLRDGGRPC